MLAGIWYSSLLLGAISLGVMLFLIARRVWTRQATERNAQMRRAAITALVQFGGDRDVANFHMKTRKMPVVVIADAAAEFIDLVRGEERVAVLKLMARRGVPAHLARELQVGNEPRRLHAAEMLAMFSRKHAIEPLLGTLKRDRSREVRIAAAISLAGHEAAPPLVLVLRWIGPRGQRSRRLVELFKKFRNERMVEVEAYAQQGGGSSFLRAAAIEALSQNGALQPDRWLLSLAKDQPADVIAAVVRALGRLGHPAALPTLINALSSPDWEVRAEAAAAVGKIGRSEAMEPLISLLDDEAWPVRYAAAKSVRDIGDSGIKALRELALLSSSRAQRTASLALAEGLAA